MNSLKFLPTVVSDWALAGMAIATSIAGVTMLNTSSPVPRAFLMLIT